MFRLYWVRHGENPANITKEFSSHKVDYSLTPKGVLQAEQTADYFASRMIDAIYSSPLKRTRETAEIIARRLAMPVQIMDEFREIDVGELEGQPVVPELWQLHNSIREQWFDGRQDLNFPGGENYLMLWKRMQAGLDQITDHQESGNLIVVSHGGLLTSTLKDLIPEMKVDVQWLRTADVPNCSITEILLERRAGKLAGTLVNWASIRHLSGEAADLIQGWI
ncbi:MAG: histidine phosphatase family protein [Chloroflexi bacterium]|nr:histidine phosphatase family protein [Chloroflexota bacterium]